MKTILRVSIIFCVIGFLVTCRDNESESDPTNEYQMYETNNGEIGKAGGSIILNDGNSDLKGMGVLIPEGAVNQPVNISFTIDKLKVVPSDSSAILVSYEPKGLVFNKPVEIMLPYKGKGTPTAWYYNSKKEEFEKLKILSSSNGIVKAETDHFSVFYAEEDGVYADINLYNINNKIKCKVQFGRKYGGKLIGIGGINLTKSSVILSGLQYWEALQLLESGEPFIGTDRMWVSIELELMQDRTIGNTSIEKKQIAIKRIGNEVGKLKAKFYKKNKSGNFESFYETGILPDRSSLNNYFSGGAIVVEFDELPYPEKKYFIKTSWVLCDNMFGNGIPLYTRWTNRYEVSSKTESDGIWTVSLMSKSNPDLNNSWVNDVLETTASKPTVTTSDPTGLTTNSAVVGGNVASDGNDAVTERGIYYGVSQNPESTGTKVSVGNGLGQFSKTLTGLISDKVYYVTAYAKNSADIAYGLQKQFRTSPPSSAPVADFTASKTNVLVNESILFTDHSTNSPTSWLWTFSDGSTSTVQNPTKSYSTKGTYTVSLKATNSTGNNTKTITGYITVNDPGTAPIADFTASNTNVLINESIQFTDKTTNDPTSWLWNFGDGTTSSVQNPTKKYSAKGTYTVSLKATNNYGSNTKTMTGYITVSESGGSGETGSFTDTRDGKTYKTIKIGNQWWMAENLAYLPEVHPPTSGSTTEPHYYVYDYSGKDVAAAKQQANYTTYGVLYNWNAAKSVCPPGWHLPTDDEWKQLEMELGMTQAQANSIGLRGTDQGIKLRADSWNGINSCGFSAIPGGNRDGQFNQFWRLGSNSYWWTSTEYDGDNSKAWRRYLYYSETGVNRISTDKNFGCSVRCIKD